MRKNNRGNGFSFNDKRNYYKSRMSLSDRNKSAYAKGFVNGSCYNYMGRHYDGDKYALKDLFGELKGAKCESDRSNILESISYVKGCLRGYEEKEKNKK